MKKGRSERFKHTFKALSKAAFNAGFSFQQLSEAITVLDMVTQKRKQEAEKLDLAGKRGSAAGKELRQKFLKGAAPVTLPL